MKRNILEIYAMVACLFAGIYGLSIISFSISDILFLVHPEWEMMSASDRQYVSNEAFCDANFASCRPSFDTVARISNSRVAIDNEDAKKLLQEQEDRWAKEDAEKQAKYSPEAITQKRLEAFEIEKKMQHERSIMALIHNVIQLLIISGVFFIHWQIGRKARAVPVVGS